MEEAIRVDDGGGAPEHVVGQDYKFGYSEAILQNPLHVGGVVSILRSKIVHHYGLGMWLGYQNSPLLQRIQKRCMILLKTLIEYPNAEHQQFKDSCVINVSIILQFEVGLIRTLSPIGNELRLPKDVDGNPKM